MADKKIRRAFSRPSKRSYDEKFFPARPEQLVSSIRDIARKEITVPTKGLGLPLSSNPLYVNWLAKESMLYNAVQQAQKYSGTAMLWRKPFAKPQPRRAVAQASVWFTAYPISMITKGKKFSILSALADEKLWDAFQEIGIRGLHTGPMKIAGGVKGWNITPSIDGHFDRISNDIDPMFGTPKEYKNLCVVAERHNGIIIDDIVPGHTGKGADFRLATMAYRDYPGIYHMIEIEKKDWHLLPDVPKNKDSINIDEETERELKKAGYIIGKLQRVIFYEPGVKVTNWSVTKPVRGVDGKKRRWVYLHYFKSGQPSISWLDPTFNGMKLVVGDALHSIGDLGARGLRLDANGFLGLETSSDDTPAWSEGHPLSVVANQIIAGMVRKVGGFTFQELNLSIDDIKAMSADGADLSYDFINRTAYYHALATGNTEFLRLMLREAKRIGVDPAALIHALQNHDELTTELVHFWTIHKDDTYSYKEELLSGSELRDTIREEITSKLVGEGAPYNLPFTENGIACTTATAIAASLGYWDLSSLDDTQIRKITKVHLLLAMFNAFQPGVFALSGWDLSGCLTLDPAQIEELLHDGDTRWINRGAYDLLNNNSTSKISPSGMPKAPALYGPLDAQLKNSDSFASRLKEMLEVRERYNIATAYQLDIPDVKHEGMLVLVHRLPKTEDLQVTILNFSDESFDTAVYSEHFVRDTKIVDMFTGEPAGHVNGQQEFTVSLQAYEGKSYLIRSPAGLE